MHACEAYKLYVYAWAYMACTFAKAHPGIEVNPDLPHLIWARKRIVWSRLPTLRRQSGQRIVINPKSL